MESNLINFFRRLFRKTPKFKSGSGTFIVPEGTAFLSVTMIGGGGGGGVDETHLTIQNASDEYLKFLRET